MDPITSKNSSCDFGRPCRLTGLRVVLCFLALFIGCGRLGAGESPAFELIRWDATNLGTEALSLAAAAWDEAVSGEGKSGLLAAGAGLKRSEEDHAEIFVVQFTEPKGLLSGSVEEALENGDYLKFSFRGQADGRLKLSRLVFRVGASNPEFKLSVVSNRTGLTSAGLLPFEGLESRSVENFLPVWKGGSVYTVDLSAHPALQDIPGGEVVEFYLVAHDVTNRYAYWGISSRGGPAVALYGTDLAAP